jgi:hypothetical protein
MPPLRLHAGVAATLAAGAAMELPLSHAAGPTDPPWRDITPGHLLAGAAETLPERLALIQGLRDPAITGRAGRSSR